MHRLRGLFYWILLASVVYTPLRDFVFILSHNHLPHLAEAAIKYIPDLIPLFGLALAIIISWPKLLKWRQHPKTVLFALMLLAWAFLSVLYGSASLWQGMRGVRVDFGGLMAFLIIWLFPPTKKQAGHLIAAILILAAALLIIAVPEFWWNHAFRVWAGQDLQRHFVDKLSQLRSITSGPNPLGTLLAVFAALVLRGKQTRLALIGLFIIGLALGLTYARSAEVCTAIMAGGYFFFMLIRKHIVVWGSLILGAGLIIGSFAGALRYHESFINVITHGASNAEHAEATGGAVKHSAELPFSKLLIGGGEGTAGPVTYGTKQKEIIAESWYVQLVQEIGLAGLGFYLALLFFVLKDLAEAQEWVLWWLSLGLIINAITLHTWSSDFNLNMIYWVIAGLAIFVPGISAKDTHEDSH